MEDRVPSTDDSNENHSPRASTGESAKATGSSLKMSHGDTSTSQELPTPKTSYSLEDAHVEVKKLIKSGSINVLDVPAVMAVLKEHASLKEKVDKLKSLLGRSAKAQRETKVDFEASQKRLNQALREIERLNQKLDKLQSRPTHCK